MTDVPLATQIRCVERELSYRRRCYPKWVQRGSMEQKKAQYELDAMEAVLATLKKVQDGGQQKLF